MTETIAEVRSGIEAAREERLAVQSDLETIEREIAAHNRQIAALEAGIAENRQRLEELRRRSADLEVRRDRQQDIIAQYLRSAYRTGSREYLKLLLNQQDIASSARLLRYYRYFTDARAARIEAFSATLQELAAVREDIRRAGEELEQRRSRLVTEQSDLEASQSQRESLLAELDAELATEGARLEQLRTEREEMARLIEELSRAIAEIPLGAEGRSFAELKGSLPWPLDGPLLNSYGASYNNLADLNWQGVTIAGQAGAPVRAIHHGRVVFSDWFSGSGLLLIIDHGDGYMSLYAHNQLLYREVGDWVNTGEVIAAVGNSGGRRETGLYFEIRHNGQSQDPTVWCASR